MATTVEILTDKNESGFSDSFFFFGSNFFLFHSQRKDWTVDFQLGLNFFYMKSIVGTPLLISRLIQFEATKTN